MKVQPKEYLAERPFLQMPLEIWNSDLSLHAKCLYMTLMNRGKLSELNGHQDEQGVYAFCTIEQAGKELSCKKDKTMKTFRELEERGLIVRERRGAMRSNYYYLRGLKESHPNEKVQAPPPQKAAYVPKKAEFTTNHGCYSSFDINELQAILDRGGGRAPF